jgi:riboflavin synthase
MFTGLIESTGTIHSLTPTGGAARITVLAPTVAERLRLGDSVAVSGVCLTALDLKPDRFSADLAAETLARTTLGQMLVGSVVNLELPTPAGAPLGGHVVQGHVDGTGVLLALEPLGADWRLRLRIPRELVRYVVPQGSITVEGISLTVAGIERDEVSIAVIPHTYATTNLHTLAVGSALNVEVDVLGKYAERRASGVALTESFLITKGY